MICPHCKENINHVYIIHMSESYTLIDNGGTIHDILGSVSISGITKASCINCGGEVTSRIEDPDGFFG